jgi:hypothetical protein
MRVTKTLQVSLFPAAGLFFSYFTTQVAVFVSCVCFPVFVPVTAVWFVTSAPLIVTVENAASPPSGHLVAGANS